VQNNRVWQRACGLAGTVVEVVDIDDKDNAIIVSVRPMPGHATGVDGAAAGHRSMTKVLAGDVGVPSTPAPHVCLSKPMHHGSNAGRTARQSRECLRRPHRFSRRVIADISPSSRWSLEPWRSRSTVVTTL
jgi:hypothetical protein